MIDYISHSELVCCLLDEMGVEEHWLAHRIANCYKTFYGDAGLSIDVGEDTLLRVSDFGLALLGSLAASLVDCRSEELEDFNKAGVTYEEIVAELVVRCSTYADPLMLSFGDLWWVARMADASGLGVYVEPAALLKEGTSLSSAWERTLLDDDPVEGATLEEARVACERLGAIGFFVRRDSESNSEPDAYCLLPYVICCDRFDAMTAKLRLLLLGR